MSSKEYSKINKFEISRRIRQLRGPKTQVEFATMVGIRQGHITKYEKGMVPNAENLLRIADACEVSTDWILTGQTEKTGTEPEMPEEYLELLRKARELEANQMSDKKLAANLSRNLKDSDKIELALTWLKELESMNKDSRAMICELVCEACKDPNVLSKLHEHMRFLGWSRKQFKF